MKYSHMPHFPFFFRVKYVKNSQGRKGIKAAPGAVTHHYGSRWARLWEEVILARTWDNRWVLYAELILAREFCLSAYHVIFLMEINIYVFDLWCYFCLYSYLFVICVLSSVFFLCCVDFMSIEDSVQMEWFPFIVVLYWK